jgi:hypothetical protein
MEAQRNLNPLRVYNINRTGGKYVCVPVQYVVCTHFWYCNTVPFKGIVQRDLTGVETRLKRSTLMNSIVAKFAF